MKLLNIETPVTRNFIPQILLNVQDFYFHKVGYTSYHEGIFGPYTEFIRARSCMWPPFTRICNKNYCRSGPSGLEQRVTLWVDAKVSQEHSDSKFRAVDGTLVSTGKSTWCFSAEHHPHVLLRENKVSHVGKAVNFMRLWSTCCQHSPVMGPEAEVCCHCWISWSHSEVYAVILLKAFCLWNVRIYFVFKFNFVRLNDKAF
jgi:hypothetical protein